MGVSWYCWWVLSTFRERRGSDGFRQRNAFISPRRSKQHSRVLCTATRKNARTMLFTFALLSLSARSTYLFVEQDANDRFTIFPADDDDILIIRQSPTGSDAPRSRPCGHSRTAAETRSRTSPATGKTERIDRKATPLVMCTTRRRGIVQRGARERWVPNHGFSVRIRKATPAVNVAK